MLLSTFLPSIGYSISSGKFYDDLTGKVVKNSDGTNLLSSAVATNASYFCNIEPNGSTIIDFTIDCRIMCWVQELDKNQGYEISSYNRVEEERIESYSIDVSKESTTWEAWVAQASNPKFSIKDGYVMHDGQDYVFTKEESDNKVLSTDLIKNDFCYYIRGGRSEVIYV